MALSSLHLQLRVPSLERHALSLCDASPKELKRWIDELPKANLGETARLLYHCLVELNQLITSSNNRFQLLELLRPQVHYVCEHLARHFLNQSIVLDERPRKVANLCQALQNHLAIGYKLVIAHEVPRLSKENGPIVTVALQRATHSLYGPLVRASQLYCPVPEGLWLELHLLYQIASSYGFHQVPVQDTLSRSGHTTQEQIYLCALLLGASRCNQMRQSNIAHLANALEQWAPLSKLLPAQSPNSLLAIAPFADAPPRYKSLFKESEWPQLLGLDPQLLVDSIKEYLLLGEDERTNAQLTVPTGISAELLQHLASAWGDITERTFQRHTGQGILKLCIGMSALHFNLSGQRSFSTLTEQGSSRAHFAERSIDDPWSNVSASGQNPWGQHQGLEEIRYRDSNADFSEVDESYPSYELPVINHSPGGYCLLWPREVPQQLQAGELLGIQDAPEQNWSVAVVRWIRQIRGGTQMGIELVAPHAQPCAAQLVRAKEQNSQFLRALLLPEMSIISRPSTLITPRLPFQEKHRVVILHDGQRNDAVLERKQTSTSSFSQFEYRLSRSESQEPVANATEASSTSKEDFDSLWKSL